MTYGWVTPEHARRQPSPELAVRRAARSEHESFAVTAQT